MFVNSPRQNTLRPSPLVSNESPRLDNSPRFNAFYNESPRSVTDFSLIGSRYGNVNNSSDRNGGMSGYPSSLPPISQNSVFDGPPPIEKDVVDIFNDIPDMARRGSNKRY